MDSLRIDSGIKEIEVNDAGERIWFSANDSGFYKRFTDFVCWFNEQKDREEIKDAEERNNKSGTKDGDCVGFEDVKDCSDIQYVICKEACEKIDSIFGEDASRKVFGAIIPDLILITEFLKAVSPFIDKYMKERSQAINKKYSKSRKGAKS